jgi:hypothetical protein
MKTTIDLPDGVLETNFLLCGGVRAVNPLC